MPVADYSFAESSISDLVAGFMFLSWGVSIYYGAEIGNSKGRLITGIILALSASWLGVLIVACLDNEKRRKIEDQRHAEWMAVLRPPIATHEPLPTTDFARFSTPGLPVEVPRFRVARRGKDLGEKGLPEIQFMLQKALLAADDQYLDPVSNQWLPLARHPGLAIR